jgi:hypothetical protein
MKTDYGPTIFREENPISFRNFERKPGKFTVFTVLSVCIDTVQMYTHAYLLYSTAAYEAALKQLATVNSQPF